MNTVISVVVPVFNEELVINETYRRLSKVLEDFGESYEIVFINDGSKDKTAEMIKGIIKSDKHIRLIDFSRNFGHQSAITAGMEYAKGDAIVIIDADLQDPPELIPRMVEIWREGYEVVYGKRTKRKGETFFKLFTAKMYYRFLKSVTNVDIPVDTGDFRLIDKKVVDAMKKLPEKNRYVRGLISWVGFRQTALEYERDERFAGETKYPLKKMIKFAMDGIAAFSYKPLKLATYLGVLISFISFVYLIFVVLQKIFFPASSLAGWTSIIAIISLTQGFVLLVLGIIGEYIGRIFDEIKMRPVYLVREALGYDKENDKENN